MEHLDVSIDLFSYRGEQGSLEFERGKMSSRRTVVDDRDVSLSFRNDFKPEKLGATSAF